MNLSAWIESWFGRGHSIDELARRLGVSLDHLCSIEPRYQRFDVPKRSGRGVRRITAPDPTLKVVQQLILHRLLRRLRAHDAAMGFERDRSIVTHACRHVGQGVVVRMDIRNFFETTTSRRVHNYFLAIGWGRRAADLLTRLCTWEGHLPQGAPTSPRLSNLVNYQLDVRLAALANSQGACYSRYADDITLSMPGYDKQQVLAMIGGVRRICAGLNYKLHHRHKLNIRRSHHQQRVTGLVVNETVGLPRQTRRWLRAVEHRLATTGACSLTPAELQGWRGFQAMVVKQAGRKSIIDD